MVMHTVIRNAEIGGTPGLDLRMNDGTITAIGPALSASGAEVVDARGGAVIPGLTDHHLHLTALAASDRSVDCGPPAVRSADELSFALSKGRPDEHGWIRGVRYSSAVAGEIDRRSLDRLHSKHPVRIQDRSGALWTVNTRAVDALELNDAAHPGVERDHDGVATGRIWRADAWLRERLPTAGTPDLGSVGRRLASFGITSVTDATPDLSADSLDMLRAAMVAGRIRQRVQLLGVPLDMPDVAASDSANGMLTRGPYKIVIADSNLPEPDHLIDVIGRSHSIGRPVAVHCVSVEALVLLLFVFDEVGSIDGDRIEHASVVPADCISRIRELRLRVVTQPGFIADRGDDYLSDVDSRDLPGLYRCASLLDHSVPLALSSDAPYGPLDPWIVIAAAVNRRTPAGALVGSSETIDPAAALDAYLSPADDPGGAPVRLTVGGDADLVVLSAPLSDVLAHPSSRAVRATYIAGVRV